MTMLDLQLRNEFRGNRLRGTTVDFTNQAKTGALDLSGADFLRITYPSFDLRKTIEYVSPGQSRPVVLMGSRGQGKSHLLAAIYHQLLIKMVKEFLVGNGRLILFMSALHLEQRQIVQNYCTNILSQ